jgi:type II secretory pathway component PulC
VLIKQILPDRIIVTGGDNEKEVKLRSSLAAVAAAGILTTTGEVILPAAAPTTNLVGSRYRQYLVDASEVAAAFAEPKRLLDSVSMHYVDRTPRDTGVRIGSFGPESVFASMGLRTGDLLLSVNDQSVTGTDDALTKLQAMLDDGQAELKVRRRARTYRFHLQAE